MYGVPSVWQAVMYSSTVPFLGEWTVQWKPQSSKKMLLYFWQEPLLGESMRDYESPDSYPGLERVGQGGLPDGGNPSGESWSRSAWCDGREEAWCIVGRQCLSQAGCCVWGRELWSWRGESQGQVTWDMLGVWELFLALRRTVKQKEVCLCSSFPHIKALHPCFPQAFHPLCQSHLRELSNGMEIPHASLPCGKNEWAQLKIQLRTQRHEAPAPHFRD